MFITKELKDQVQSLLGGLKARVEFMKTLASRTDAWEAELVYVLAAERALHTGVEYTTDIASLIIDALVMRDPGSYSDIIKVLVEENVLPEDWFMHFEGIFPLRARFIRDHATLRPDEIRLAIDTYHGMFDLFIERIVTFLGLPSLEI